MTAGRRDEESWAQIEVCAPAAVAEVLVAEAWEAGAGGVEERAGSGEAGRGGEGGGREGCDTVLLVYAPAGAVERVHTALVDALRRSGSAEARVGEFRAVEGRDWSLAWQERLEPIEVGERLVVRPSFRAAVAKRLDLVIDPGQAFGTGGHASTRLALEWIASLGARGALEGRRVLDAGTGTGVLALAALRLGAASAVGFDLDALAAPEARRWAVHNGLSDRLACFTGPLDALAGPPFGLVVANMLSRELRPILPGLAAATRPGGWLILSGLLEREEVAMSAALARVGLAVEGRRRLADGNEDAWLSLLASPTAEA